MQRKSEGKGETEKKKKKDLLSIARKGGKVGESGRGKKGFFCKSGFFPVWEGEKKGKGGRRQKKERIR